MWWLWWFFGLVVAAVVIFVLCTELYDARKRLRGMIAPSQPSVGQTTDGVSGYSGIPIQVAQHNVPDVRPLLQGLVSKKETITGGRKVANYYTTSDKVPKFRSISEAANFGMGLFTLVDEPTVANISPFGEMTLTDNYIAMKLVAQHIFEQIKELNQITVTLPGSGDEPTPNAGNQ
jgi:hypothetical protein